MSRPVPAERLDKTNPIAFDIAHDAYHTLAECAHRWLPTIIDHESWLAGWTDGARLELGADMKWEGYGRIADDMCDYRRGFVLGYLAVRDIRRRTHIAQGRSLHEAEHPS